MRYKKGFTLIELLVVIAIIGILATVSVISLSNARVKSRDVKRAGDARQIQTALELFFNDNGRYPTATEWSTGKIFSTTTSATTTYMQIIPTAPTPADGNCVGNQNVIGYTPSDDGSSYSLSFCLGNNVGTLTAGPKCLTPGGIVDIDCTPFICGTSQVTVTSISGHACNTGAPDYDSCVYDSVEIGSQCWMKQNMNIGSIVTGVTDQTDNSNLEKYCYGDSSFNCQNYGALYQLEEAMDYSTTEGSIGICPPGWHIPTDAEVYILENYLKDPGQACDASRVNARSCDPAGTRLKRGVSTSGFDAAFAGVRDIDGSFFDKDLGMYLFSSSVDDPSAYRNISNQLSTVGRYYHSSFDFGFSVRCLKD